MISMTYGQLPTRKQFNTQFRSIVGKDDFQMHLKGHDADCAEEHAGTNYTDGNNHYDVDELWHIVVALRDAYENEGVGCAGDLASSIFYTLDIEWI